MKYKFKWENDYEDQPKTTVTMTTDAVTLPELLTDICSFLIAVGFQIPYDSLLVEKNLVNTTANADDDTDETDET